MKDLRKHDCNRTENQHRFWILPILEDFQLKHRLDHWLQDSGCDPVLCPSLVSDSKAVRCHVDLIKLKFPNRAHKMFKTFVINEMTCLSSSLQRIHKVILVFDDSDMRYLTEHINKLSQHLFISQSKLKRRVVKWLRINLATNTLGSEMKQQDMVQGWRPRTAGPGYCWDSDSAGRVLSLRPVWRPATAAVHGMSCYEDYASILT
jgi:hypothetical protein